MTLFFPSFGSRPQTLIGRNELINAFTSGLSSRPGSRERTTLILGQRGTGKTVLLLELAEKAKAKGFVAASPTIVSGNMLERIVEKIQDAGESDLNNSKQHLTGATFGALGFSAGLQFSREIQETKSFSYKLSRLTRALNNSGKGLLILIDEVQGSNAGLKELIIAYQELIGEGANIAMVLAGLPGAISATLNNHVLTFLNRAEKKTLEPLKASEIHAYFKQSFGQLGVKLTDYDLADLTEKTEGSPYLMQLIGHNITQYAGDDGHLDPAALKTAVDFAQESYMTDICTATLNNLSEKDIEFLQAMLTGKRAVKMSEIREKMGISPDYAQSYKRRLIDAGVVIQSRRGEVEFSLPLLAVYLEKMLSEE